MYLPFEGYLPATISPMYCKLFEKYQANMSQCPILMERERCKFDLFFRATSVQIPTV